MIILAWIRDAAEWLWAISPIKYTIISIVRLGLAALLGGIIGYEREHSHRPAGFRTHILVAVGSAVVMLTAVYMTERYPDKLDMSRMPAQVVSGIGFLGLTTAASLWAVSCVGLAVGSGFFVGAFVATFVIYLTLNSLKKVVARGHAGKALYIEVKDLADEVPQLSKIIRRSGAVIHSMEILYDSDSKLRKKKNTSTIKALIFPKSDESLNMIISTIRADENVVDIYVD